ncbi:hypothetical protein GOODEAATRI_034499, partial [Goodea atripinnis]
LTADQPLMSPPQLSLHVDTTVVATLEAAPATVPVSGMETAAMTSTRTVNRQLTAQAQVG